MASKWLLNITNTVPEIEYGLMLRGGGEKRFINHRQQALFPLMSELISKSFIRE